MSIKIAQMMAEEVVKQSFEKTKSMAPSAQNGESSFKDLLGSMGADGDMAKSMGVGESAEASMRFDSISASNIDVKGVDFGSGAPTDGKKAVVDFLSEVNNLQGQMDSVVSEVLYSGKQFSMQELLAIQAHVFHVAQVTELTVKVADQGVSSTKAVLNTQIQ